MKNLLRERQLWGSEIDSLAHRLANKSENEILEIFEMADIIELREVSVSDKTVILRILLLISIPLAFCLFNILSTVKYVITGSGYLDSWAKRHKFLRKAIDFYK